MKFPSPLIPGKLIKRYKRFLADVELTDGSLITAHCPNSGSMLDITSPHNRVWLSRSQNLARKLPYTWEIVEVDGQMIGTNTGNPNLIVREILNQEILPEFASYSSIKPEVKYGENSRIDFLLTSDQRPPCYLEVKNVHLKRGHSAAFPDSITTRGSKHMSELIRVVEQGYRAAVFYVVQRSDCKDFEIAKDIDPTYYDSFFKALAAGVEYYIYSCDLSLEEIKLNKSLPLKQS